MLRSGSAIANALFHSTGGGATEHNENVFVSATGAKVAGAVSYLRGASDRDAAGVPYDKDAPYATWKTATYTRAQLSAIFGADGRTNVGTLTALDLRNRGVSGRLISVTLVGSSRDEDRVGRRLHLRLQRRAPGRRSPRAQHPPRPRADPLRPRRDPRPGVRSIRPGAGRVAPARARGGVSR